MHRTRGTSAVLLLGILLPLSACAPSSESFEPGAGNTGAPINVENCGDTVSFAGAPQRVTLLDNPAVSTLAALDVLDRVTAKAGLYPTQYYSAQVAGQLEQIPTLTDRVDATGHLQISRETVVATQPDLVIGSSGTVNRQTLGSTGIPLLDEPAFCGSRSGEATFNEVYEQVELYGTVFAREATAQAYIQQLQHRVDTIGATIPEHEERSVAVLYPTVGSTVTYAYGTSSMSHPLVSTAGLDNVFASETERVFEVTTEELIDRNPDVIITLYSAGDAEPIVDAVTALPGAEALTAVQNDTIFPMLLSFAEPPSPLAVDGLEKLVDYLEQTR